MRAAGCPICGSDAAALRQFAARGTESSYLFRCGGCACEFLDPQPSDAWLSGEYSGYFARREADVDRPKAGYFRRLLSDLGIDLSGRRVLDVGSGEGDCVVALNRLFPTAEVTALEANPEAGPCFRGLRCRFVPESIEIWLGRVERRPFDAVLAFDVLEHLRNPVGILRALRERVASSGSILVATFPRADAPSRTLLGPLWPHFKVEHLHYFSRGSVEKMAQAAGWETGVLRPLVKRLPVGFLMSAGAGFGPKATRRLAGLAQRLVPAFLSGATVPVCLGEWLWLARPASNVQRPLSNVGFPPGPPGGVRRDATLDVGRRTLDTRGVV